MPTDQDECFGAPCGADATCKDSLDTETIADNKFVCTCTIPGFGYSGSGGLSIVTFNAGDKPGLCVGKFAAFLPLSYIIDRNECTYNACGSGSTCSDSSTVPAVGPDKFRCTCTPGKFFPDSTVSKDYAHLIAPAMIEGCGM